MKQFPITEHLEGDFETAETKYLRYKTQFPENTDVSFWLGYLYFQKNDYSNSEKNIVEFLKTNPDNVKALNLLGLVYKNKTDYVKAIEILNRCINIAPQYNDAIFNLATLFIEIQKYSEAIDLLKNLTSNDENDAEPYFYIGYCYQQLGNNNLALHFYQHSVQLGYSSSQAFVNTALIYINQQEFDSAISIINNGLEIFENDEQLFLTLAAYYEKTKNNPKAIETYTNLIKSNPYSFEASFNLGNIYKSFWQLDSAISCYLAALNISPNNQDALLNLGITYHSKIEFDSAIECFNKILELNPKNQDALNNLGGTYFEIGNYDLAIETYKKAITVNPNSPLEHFNLGICLLLIGDLKNGFKEYEWRKKLSEYKREFSIKEWSGEPLYGQKIYVYAEQGIGDIFQFVRYLKVLKKLGGIITLECRKEVFNLMTNLNFIDFVVKRGTNIQESDYNFYSSLLSLPAILNSDLSNIPNTVPYLEPNPVLTKKWEDYFSKFTKPKIGIVWKGNPFPIEHRKRHTELKYFTQLAKLTNYSFFSLQYGEDCQEELEKAEIIDLAYNFDETAAIITNLDLVITIDTSIAHLAGALGKKVWILLTKVPDWRWLLKIETTPWYPTAKLFRQNELNNWSEVFEKVKSTLEKELFNQDNIITEMTNEEINRLKLFAAEAIDNNDLDKAIQLYHLLLKNNSEDIESLVWIGAAYFYKNDFNSAKFFLNKAVSLFPDLPEELYQNLAVCHINLEDYINAETFLKKALNRFPNSHSLLNNLGILYSKLKNETLTKEYFQASIKICPTYLAAWINLISFYYDKKEYEQAIDLGLTALSIEKNNGIVLKLIGDSYLSLDRLKDAEIYFKKAVLFLNDDRLFNNYAITLQKQNKLFLAEVYFQKAIELSPNNSGYLSNFGNNYALKLDFENALNLYSKALQISPDNPVVISQVGMIHLLTEKFEVGWREFETSLTKSSIFDKLKKGKPYNGESLEGKTILVYSEHGFGDILQFVRYIPLLKNLGCNILFEFPKEFTELFNYPNGYYEPIIRGEFNYDQLYFDFYTSLLSLPRIFCTNLANIPNIAPILHLNKDLLNVWKQRLSTKRPKIGLVWAGNPYHPNNHNRSIPFEFFELLFNNTNIDFYLLQKNFGLNNTEEYKNRFNNIIDFSNELSTIEVSASILLNMDLVITVDTMMAHLCGILNIPTLLLLPYLPDWRWLLNRNDSVWYSSISILRQPTPGDWISVMEDLNNKILFKYTKSESIKEIKQFTDKFEYGKAIDLIKETIEQSEDEKPQLLFELGKILLHTKDYGGAIEIFNSILLMNSTNFDIYYHLGYSFHMLKEINKAKEFYNRTLKYHPYYINALNNLGLIYRDEEQLEYADELFQKAVELNFYKPFLHNNLGTVYEAKGDLIAAKEEFSIALSLNKNYVEGYINLSNTEHYLGEFDNSLMHIDKAIELAPQNAEAHFNKALLLLRMGFLKEGFTEYEWRIMRSDYPIWEFSKPLLSNLEDAAEKTLLIYDEQGFGDTLQFGRYIERIKACNCTTILLCHAPLVDLMTGCKGVDKVIGRNSFNDYNIEYDYRIPLLSLGTLFETNITEIKVTVPYIMVDINTKLLWQNRLAADKKVKIGFVWKGKQTPGNKHRSCKLTDYLKLFNNSKVSFYSLQMGEVEENKDRIFKQYNITDLSGSISTFNDTAAIMDNLDLIISIDTSVAHLAGALGKKTWVLLSTKCDWRWYNNRKDNPWYPTLELFRQEEFNNWDSVFTEVDKRLKQIITKIN